MNNIRLYFGARNSGKSVSSVMIARARLDANPDLPPIYCSPHLYELAKSLGLNLDRIVKVEKK